jgi:hypothetical protein
MHESQVEAKEDSRYDAVTEAQRDAYYVNPGVWTRFARWFPGPLVVRPGAGPGDICRMFVVGDACRPVASGLSSGRCRA